jgi:hypothetical protein
MFVVLAFLWFATFLLLNPSAAHAQTFRDVAPGAIGFGGATLIAGDQVLIGRPGTLIGFPMPANHAGAVHVFRRVGDRWTESGMFAPKDGTLGDGFGTALAADGNLLAVGAPGAAGGGAVYLFERGSGGRWTQRARLSSATGADGDRFGAALALKGGVLLAGAPGREGEKGAVLVFRRGKGSGDWAARGVIQGSGTAADDWFGASLAFDGQRALIGAPGPWTFDSTRWKPGQAFVFLAGKGSDWSEQARLAQETTDRFASMGVAVLFDGPDALVGVPRADSVAGAVPPPGASPRTRWSGRPHSGRRSPATATTCWSALRCRT